MRVMPAGMWHWVRTFHQYASASGPVGLRWDTPRVGAITCSRLRAKAEGPVASAAPVATTPLDTPRRNRRRDSMATSTDRPRGPVTGRLKAAYIRDLNSRNREASYISRRTNVQVFPKRLN